MTRIDYLNVVLTNVTIFLWPWVEDSCYRTLSKSVHGCFLDIISIVPCNTVAVPLTRQLIAAAKPLTASFPVSQMHHVYLPGTALNSN